VICKTDRYKIADKIQYKSNLITICFADYFMQSIYIPDVLLVVISAFMAFIELAFDNQPNREAA
ncbi:MAG: YrvL family regulatory protein, partial [Bacillota bacterium]|nr:YrvL family regulatory protein [Bacillota bacterium]